MARGFHIYISLAHLVALGFRKQSFKNFCNILHSAQGSFCWTKKKYDKADKTLKDGIQGCLLSRINSVILG